MRCKACDHSELCARIELQRDVPLAARSGGIKVGGIKVSQLDLKETWETEPLEDGSTQERVLRGPIFCSSCGAEHFLVMGTKDPLFLGSYAEALELGAESFLEA